MSIHKERKKKKNPKTFFFNLNSRKKKKSLKPTLNPQHEKPFNKPHNTQRCQINSTVLQINWLA